MFIYFSPEAGRHKQRNAIIYLNLVNVDFIQLASWKSSNPKGLINKVECNFWITKSTLDLRSTFLERICLTVRLVGHNAMYG